MRIAFIVGRFPSLSETFILNQITGLMDLGHEVDIFAVKRSDDSKAHPEIKSYRLMERTHFIDIPKNKFKRIWRALRIMVKHLPSTPRPVLKSLNSFRFGAEALSFSLLISLEHFLENGPYDILNCHFGKQGLRGMRLKELGVPGKLIVNSHGYDISQSVIGKGENIYTNLFDHADLLMPVSEFWKRKLISLGARADSILVHHMGIDLQRFEFRPRVRQPGEPVRLFTVGRLVEKKGIDYSLQALAQLLQRHPDWDIHYMIIGEGPQLGKLEEMVQSLGLEHVVEFAGSAAHDEVLRQMTNSHLYLLPSVTSADGDQEGIPVSMMEAMATGMPVLSTFHSGIPELVEDGVSGFLVNERDVDGLSERLEYIIQHPEIWEEMARRGRDFVDKHYNIATLNRDLIITYQELLSDSHGLPVQAKISRSKSASADNGS